MRYVGIIERLADGPRYEDAYLASKPRGSASRTPAASAHHAWCRSRYVIELPGQPARVPAVLHEDGPTNSPTPSRADQVFWRASGIGCRRGGKWCRVAWPALTGWFKGRYREAVFGRTPRAGAGPTWQSGVALARSAPVPAALT